MRIECVNRGHLHFPPAFSCRAIKYESDTLQVRQSFGYGKTISTASLKVVSINSSIY